MDFTHLHVHSHFSLLEAVPQIGDLVEKAKFLGYSSLALTDSNNLYGAIEFQKECEKKGIKPIIGCELNLVEKSMFDPISNENRIFKIVLLCKNEVGYWNLVKLVSHAHIIPENKIIPCIDFEELKKFNDGLICFTGSIESFLWEKLRQDDFASANIFLNNLEQIFPETPDGKNLFIEINYLPNLPDGKKIFENLRKISEDSKIPLLATSNVFYLNTGDKSAQKVLMGISNDIDAKDRYKRTFLQGNFSLASKSEIEKNFENLPEAILNTKKIDERCNFKITLGKWVFPKIDIPESKTPDEYLREIVFEGFEKRKIEQEETVLKRVNYELDVIKMKGYAPYFLAVADMLKFARENGILTNIRGSVSGSMVTFLAGITNINPIEFEIPFERFLNPDRPSAPDIDMDYADNRREEMIEYVKTKYGADKIAQIGTFGTMAARAAVRDVARSMGYPYLVGDRISKMIPMGSQGFPMTLDRALEEEPEFKKDYEENRETKEIVDMAKKIEGNVRHMGIHAAGVLISPTDLNDFTPIQFDPKGEHKIISQYDMYSVEDAGLLKFDFLGLGNLAIIADAIYMIEKNCGVKLDYDTIPMDDKKTFEMLANGETIDTFQLNGTGMTKFLMELKPTTIHDINAMVALYRPGPLQFIPEYIKRKHKPELVTYLDEALEPILKKTFGILVYQDDLLMMAHKLAGYSWGEVDKFRKAVGKKIPEEMAAQKEKFIKGCVEYSGWSKEKATELWAWIEPFAAYGFNKAHSVSYGRVAYVTAYLKANFPTEYLCAVLHSEEGEIEKVAITVKECKRLGIKILPPNVNYSEDHFSIIKKNEKYVNDAIVIGLNTIKNLGSNAVAEIIKVRNEGGKFKNLSDFIRRIDMKTTNKKSLEALICSGAFDDFIKSDKCDRSQMFLNIEDILTFQRQIHDTHAGEVSLFGEIADVSELKLKKIPPLGRLEILKLERELLGLYLSGHPLDPWKEVLKQKQVNIAKINREVNEGTNVDFPAIITNVKIMLTKKKDKMAFVQVADLEDEIETVIFPKAYEMFKDKILKDTPLIFRGKVSLKNKPDSSEVIPGNEEIKIEVKKIRDDGTEAKTYSNKSIIIDEIRNI